MNRWPDGTPKSSGNAFTMVPRKSLMANDVSHRMSKNANAKRGVTDHSPNVFALSPLSRKTK